MKATAKVLEKLESIAEDVDGKLRYEYSGRGMYGKTCVGIVCDNANNCLEVAGSYGIRGGLVDSMGLNQIVYWPKYSFTDAKTEVNP